MLPKEKTKNHIIQGTSEVLSTMSYLLLNKTAGAIMDFLKEVRLTRQKNGIAEYKQVDVLVGLYKHEPNNQEIFRVLYECHQSLIVKLVNKFRKRYALAQHDFDELYSIAAEEFFTLVNRYDFFHECSFSAFANKMLKFTLNTEAKKIRDEREKCELGAPDDFMQLKPQALMRAIALAY
jgi:hypothetical protein